jgi:hypothetical protein
MISCSYIIVGHRYPITFPNLNPFPLQERLRCRQLETDMENMSPSADHSLSEDTNEASEVQQLRK